MNIRFLYFLSFCFFFMLTYGCSGRQYLKVPDINLLPKNCTHRNQFPNFITSEIEDISGYSGLQILKGTSREYCGQQKGCRLYTKHEFEEFLSTKINGYMDTALFAILPCKTKEDYEQSIRDASYDAVKYSQFKNDSYLQSLMKDYIGEWCGKYSARQYPAELRLKFFWQDKIIIGKGTITWQRIPDGPLGEPGYVDEIFLYPLRYYDNPIYSKNGVIDFYKVNKFRNRLLWSGNKDGDSIVLTGEGETVILTHSCEGFWREQLK